MRDDGRRLPVATGSCSATSATSRRRTTSPTGSPSGPRSSRPARRATAAGWSSATVRTAAASGGTPGVLVANGTLSEPSVPTFDGSFDGEILHTSAYKSPSVFAGKRVLIIGAGNSGCDIAVDAVHHAASVDISVRRGYYFVPKYLFGKPADTLNQGRPLPPRIKQAIDSRVLKVFTGDPVRFGFPKPDYKIYESHPIVNSLVLHHLGHGDLRVRPTSTGSTGAASCSSTAAAHAVRRDRAGDRLPPALPVPEPGAAALGGPRERAGPLPQRLHAGGPEPLRARHDRGVGDRLAGPLRAGRAGRVVPQGADDEPRRRGAPSSSGSPDRGRTCPAATTTSGWNVCPTTSTRTPTAAPCGRRSSASGRN